MKCRASERRLHRTKLEYLVVCRRHPHARFGKVCYENHFCPKGTADPRTGQMADDAVNRGLSAQQANPFLDVDTLKYMGNEARINLRTLYRRADHSLSVAVLMGR